MSPLSLSFVLSIWPYLIYFSPRYRLVAHAFSSKKFCKKINFLSSTPSNGRSDGPVWDPMEAPRNQELRDDLCDGPDGEDTLTVLVNIWRDDANINHSNDVALTVMRFESTVFG